LPRKYNPLIATSQELRAGYRLTENSNVVSHGGRRKRESRLGTKELARSIVVPSDFPALESRVGIEGRRSPARAREQPQPRDNGVTYVP